MRRVTIMPSAKRLFASIAVLVFLPFISQCSKEPRGPQIRTLTPKEAAIMAPDPYGASRPRPDLKLDQELDPERQEALADLFLKTKEYDGSLLHYLQILQKEPERHEVRYKVGVILLLKGQYKGAREEFAKVLAAQPDMLKAREALGLAYMQEKEYPPAIKEFRAVLEKDPKRAQTRHLLGVTYLMANQPRDAIRELEQANSLDPRNISTYVALGQAYNQVKEYHKALNCLKKAEALNPHHKKIHYQIGMALAGLHRYDEAFAAFAKGADEAQAYNNIGVHYFMDGEYELAAKCFQKALELRPTFYEEAKNNLDRALEKLREGKKGSL
uniref:Tetratricopeptide repeat protein n=1 Tax=Desulfobacca acetoxidans TaxID=60893 RepID=A0A7C3SHE7_9BACT